MDIDTMIEKKLVHEIHTSERRSFRSCRRRWDWLFRKNYYPKVTAKPLEFGVAFHEAMEVYYNPETWNGDKEINAANAVLKFVETCETQKKNALAATDQNMLDIDVQRDYEERVELGKGMLEYYFTRVSPQIDVGWKPVKVEIGFMVAIPNPETGEDSMWCTCDTCWDRYQKSPDAVLGDGALDEQQVRDAWKGLPVVYAGRLDMLAQDAKGNYYIFDWKTARSISTDTEFLLLDDQVASYVWALRKLGIDVKGFVYHEQRKAYPLPPKKNKQRRLGRLFSVSKNEPVEHDLYLQTVQQEDAGAYREGLYDEFLAYLKQEGDMYYGRFQVIKSYNEIQETERNIGLEALDIIDQNLRIYPAPGRFGCQFCAYRQPCMEANGDGDVQYALDTLFEKREHYYIKKEASTESKGGE